MKPFSNKHKVLATVVVMSLSTTRTALAASTFSGYGTVTYTVNSIANLSNPGDLSGLEILGYFEQAGAPDFYVETTGDGAVTAANPTVGPISVGVGSSFSRTFASSGSVSDGTVSSSHLGWFSLDFNNLGSDSYSVELVLDYHLNASAEGQYADTDVFLDYFNSNESFSGADFVNASTFGLNNATKSSSTGPFIFTLGPNASDGLYANVRINGNLEASPVPLPAAVWSFLAGLLTFSSMRKRKAMA